ncbi:MAG: glycosyltransferase [Leptospirales bacterium]
MGYLVERCNVAQIEEKLRILVNDRGAAVRMAEHNHRYAKARFLASDVAGRLGTRYCVLPARGWAEMSLSSGSP